MVDVAYYFFFWGGSVSLVFIFWVCGVLVLCGRFLRPAPLLKKTGSNKPLRANRLAQLGGWLRKKAQRPASVQADLRLGRAVVAGGFLLLVHPVAALAVGGLVWLAPLWVKRRVRRQREAAVAADLPWLAGLIRLGVGAGLPIGQALTEAAQRGKGPAFQAASEAMDRTARGEPLALALEGLRSSLGEPGRPLVAALVAAVRLGAPVGPALDAAAVNLRARSRRQAEVRARKVPVQMLFPLALCILPAFVLLSVVPMVLDALGNLEVGL